MPVSCPVCGVEAEGRPFGDGQRWKCSRCGIFEISGTALSIFGNRDPSKLERAKVSYGIRRYHEGGKDIDVTSDLLRELLDVDLPTIDEQADRLVRYVAEQSPEPGYAVRLLPSHQGGLIGAVSNEGFDFVVNCLIDYGILDYASIAPKVVRDGAMVCLTFQGWEAYGKSKRGASELRLAFMALKFNERDLDLCVESVFKPAVAETGFTLRRADEEQPAGLIDDQIRVAIRQSAFVISDLSHGSHGSYWEAGFAEGAGKPVIYTCRRDKMEQQGTHFDTNHHLTIDWDPGNMDEAGRKLKATIRATLPEIAKH